MTTNAPKSDGYLDQATGTIKEKAGEMLGNKRMEAEGQATRAKGEKEVANAKSFVLSPSQEDYVKGTAEEVDGHTKETLGKTFNDKQMEMEGRQERERGASLQSKSSV